MSRINTSRNLELLRQLFPGQALLSISDSAQACAISQKKVRKDIAAGVFPVRTLKIGRRRLVAVADLADYLDSLTTPAPGPGRPRSSREGV